VLTTIRGVPRGQAKITLRVGAHLVEDITANLRLSGDGTAVDQAQFADAYRRLEAAGYDLEPEAQAWRAFARTRASFAGRLSALAGYWATPATVWVGERATSVSAVHVPEPAGLAAIEHD
jgi:hypothetical protein